METMPAGTAMAYLQPLFPPFRPAAPPDGRILVLRRERPGAAAIGFLNRRRIDLSSALVGREAGEAPRLLRRLLSSCGWAQGVACLAAVEVATDRAADPSTARARSLLVLGESALGMIRHGAVDWPRLLGEEPQLRHLRYARAALEALIAGLWRGGDPLDSAARAASPAAAEPAVSALIEAIETTVLPRAPADPLRLADWAARDPAPLARLIRAGAGLRLTGPVPGAAPLPGLPDLAAFSADPGFGRAPHLSGAAGDPTPFARQPPVPGAARFGPVGARLLAQAAEAQAALEALARLDPPPVVVHAPDIGIGAALVEGLRGPVVHRLACDGERIAAFASVAPTEWMLHPQGPLAATLAALPAGRLRRDAPLVIAAHDPCARVELQGEAATGD